MLVRWRRSRRWYRSAILAMALGLASTADVASAGQADASIYGQVTDESGAVLPGLTVTATQTDTGSTAMLSLISQETR